MLERLDSGDSHVRETAHRLLSSIKNITFCASLCGVVDICAQLAKISGSVQQVEQFPFEMKSKLVQGITDLKEMSKLSLSSLDKAAWPTLSRNLENLQSGKFHGVELKESASRKFTRSRADIGSLDCFKTVENRLRSLAKTQAKIIEERTVENQKHPYPAILELMAGCLDAQLIVDEICKDSASKDLESVGIQVLRRLCKVAGHAIDTISDIVAGYDTFKKRLEKIVQNTDEDKIREKFGSLLFETHQCSSDRSVPGNRCPDLSKVVIPFKVKNIKMLHLFLKTESLYSDIEQFLCLYLQCAVKTHAEGFAESMGSYVDIHSDKRRGLDIAVIGLDPSS